MTLRSAGLKVLRWVLWLLVAFILVRGIVTLLPSRTLPTLESGPAQSAGATEPPGLRAVPALFAQEYLTWQPGGASQRADRLAPYLIANLDRQAGWAPGQDGFGQSVSAVQTYSVHEIDANRWQVTVVAHIAPYQEMRETDPSGAERTTRRYLNQRLLRLTVPVLRVEGGGWAVYDYPTMAAMPRAGESQVTLLAGTEATDRGEQVKGLLSGFFRAYLAGNQADTAYFLSPQAALPSPPPGLGFGAIAHYSLLQTNSGHAATAEVQVADAATGARYTLRYSAELEQREGRWYIKGLIQKGE